MAKDQLESPIQTQRLSSRGTHTANCNTACTCPNQNRPCSGTIQTIMRDGQYIPPCMRSMDVPVIADNAATPTVDQWENSAGPSDRNDGLDRLTETQNEGTSTADRLTATRNEVSSASDRLTDGQDEVSSASDRLAVTQNQITPNADRVTVTQNQITPNADRLAVTQDQITTNADGLAVTQNQITANTDRLTVTQNQITPNADRLTVNNGEVTLNPAVSGKQARSVAVTNSVTAGSSSPHSTDSDSDSRQEQAAGLTKKQRKRQREKQKKKQKQQMSKHGTLQQGHHQTDKSGNHNKSHEAFEADENKAIQILKEANEQLMEENERLSLNCRVCMDEVIGVMLLPCSHSAVCTSCSQKLLQCPICRSNIQNSMHVFMVY